MTHSEVVDLWIHLTSGLALMDFIPALVLRDIIFITANILIGGVGGVLSRRVQEIKASYF